MAEADTMEKLRQVMAGGHRSAPGSGEKGRRRGGAVVVGVSSAAVANRAWG